LWLVGVLMGSGFLLNKTTSTRVGLGPKPDFFIYIVKHEPVPNLSPTTYLVNFQARKSPSPKYEA
jgi:hypothetical protein